MPQGIGYGQPPGLLGMGAMQRPPMPQPLPQQPMWPQQPVANNAGFAMPGPVVNDHAALQAILQLLAGR